MANYTYSFLDVQAALVGPGANINMGSGAAISEEGITINKETINEMLIGADGKGMHSLSANKSGQVKVSTLKDSPLNAALSILYNVQTASGAAHGQNIITITNINSGDVITCQQCAFTKYPDINYQKNGGTMEWVFDCVQIDGNLG